MLELDNINSIEKLNQISDYLNYGISVTIKKQLGKTNLELEKKYAAERLTLFIQGIENSITNLDNIRTNFKNINKFYINILLIKSAIERHAFNIVKLSKNKLNNSDDIIAETITIQVSEGNLNDILDWINSDIRVIYILVENYINFSYKSNNKFRKAHADMCIKNHITNKALEQLNFELSSKSFKQK